MLIRLPKGWEIPERETAPEDAVLRRRGFLLAAGLAGAGALGADAGKPNPEFPAGGAVTPEWAATSYNNFYEFEPADKQAVRTKTGKFVISPWTLEVGGLVAKPKTFDLDDLLRRMPIEERVYRLRCVEAWSMTLPWTGFPFSRLIDLVEPKPEARFVRFVTANRPREFPGMASAPWYPWPYFESLRMDEARNGLALLATGLYGKPLPKQNGAPVRMVLPWKYGYKSIKSIVRVEFVAARPGTFWNQMQPLEYGYYANVNPKRPHPRWSQAWERVLPTMDRQPTLPFNGYAKWVAGMYTNEEV